MAEMIVADDVQAAGALRVSERTEDLKQTIRALDNRGARRSVREDLIRESFDMTIGEPWPIRRAKAFCHILDHAMPVIHDAEILLGSLLGLFPLRKDGLDREEAYREGKRHIEGLLSSGEMLDENRATVQLEYDYLGPRVAYHDLKAVSERIATELNQAAGLTGSQVFAALQNLFCDSPQAITLLRKALRSTDSLPLNPESPLWTMAHHMAVDYERVLVNGFGGIRADAERRRAAAEDPESEEFYHAVILSMVGAARFIRGYADEARRKAQTAETIERHDELLDMAAVAGAVAEGPARSFREALQLFWFTHVILCSGGAISMATGRFDQFMYPFYSADIESGRLSRDEAFELLSCLWVKFNEPVIGPVQNMTIGGMTPNGEDAANDLTFLSMDVTRGVRVPYPNMTVRLHNGSNPEMYPKIAEMVKAGTGHPAIWNDEVMIQALGKTGIGLADARDYCVMGCIEVMIPKRQPSYEAGTSVSLPKFVRQAMLDCTRAHDFTELVSSLKRLLFEHIAREVESIRKTLKGLHRIGSDPFGSALVLDCLTRGRDMYKGGTRYPGSVGIWGVGLATAADSLAAVQRIVFDERRMTLEAFLRILDGNFHGNETFRRELLNRLPKFGNDDEYVDSIAREISEYFCTTVLSYNKGQDGVFYHPLLGSYVSHIGSGLLGATPDGRMANEPFSDAVSPVQGRDIIGPTGVINSVTKLDFTLTPGGVALNMKFHPDVLKGPEGEKILISQMQTYFKKGGLQMTMNLIGKETMIAAMEHPEAYQNLVVRVAGFNEFYVKLDPKLQMEIMERTEHGLGNAVTL
jgi:pyruvate-formate lyase